MTKILLIDEDTDLLRLLQIKLSRAGYEVSRARDGREALIQSAAVQPTLVIMDPLLPDADGLELLSSLRANVVQPPAVLILSGQANDEHIEAALSAGASDYVGKPFSPLALLERIRVNLIRTQVATAREQER